MYTINCEHDETSVDSSSCSENNLKGETSNCFTICFRILSDISEILRSTVLLERGMDDNFFANSFPKTSPTMSFAKGNMKSFQLCGFVLS